MKSESLLLEGPVGSISSPEIFPRFNYIIDKEHFDYEGNWAFCYFGRDEISAARFGFGIGKFDASDYGHTTPVSKDFMMLHIELITKKGAYLWLGNGKYKSSDLISSSEEMNVNLIESGRQLVKIIGWPKLAWKMQSDDGEIGIDAVVEIKHISVLPDNIMPNNIFAMWLATGNISGEAHYVGNKSALKGTVFYDHPRINVQPNQVPQIGWYIYVPIAFSDGSRLAAYYTTHKNASCNVDYSFALLTGWENRSVWMNESRIIDIDFNSYGIPNSWTIEWWTKDCSIRIKSKVSDTEIIKAWGHAGWGGDTIPQTKEENKNLPLVFTCTAVLRKETREYRMQGGGIAEFVRNIG